MSDTPQRPHLADTPQDNPSSSHGKAELRELYEAYLVASDAALLTGSPIPKLPAEIADSPFREQAESGLHLLQLLSRARESVLGPEAPRAGVAVPLERVAHFRMLRELGRGGHGVVYLAVDERLGREVALKVPRPETLLNPELRKRFLREAQAAGQLDHPHLVPVHEVGEEGHLVYIASQYIEGPDLAQWLLDRNTPVPPHEAAELVADLADGVEHAHVHGVLHRDIKPSNVLLADEGGGNSPRLADFGLAKLRELGSDETQTRTGVLLGTPTYMAPELAAGKLCEVGPATDVYGLGAVLYEALTGRPPFRGEHDADTIHQVIHSEPLNPQRLRPGLSSELAAICLKCLDKAPEWRYASAALLAADLRRYLNGQPTLARPATALDRCWKWAKRRPAVAGLSAVTIALACLIVTGGLWGGAWLSKSLKEAKEANHDLKDSNQQLQAANLLLQIEDRRNQGRALAAATNSAHEHLQNNNAAQGAAVLDRYLGSQSAPMDNLAVRWIRRACSGESYRIHAGTGAINALAGSHDGKLFATGGEDGTLRLWQSSDGALIHEFTDPRALPINAVAFSPRDDLILSARGDTKLSEVVAWDVLARVRLAELEAPPARVNAVAFSPDGRFTAAAGSSLAGDTDESAAEIRVWEVELAQRAAPRAAMNYKFSQPQVWRAPAWKSALSLAFTPDSGMLAVGYGGDEGNGAVGLWSVDNEKEEGVLPIAAAASALVFAADGRRLVVGDGGGGITAWSHPDRRELGRRIGRSDSRMMTLAAAADGSCVFAASTYSQLGRTRFDVVKWDVADAPEIVAALANGPDECRGLAALPDGASLLVAGGDGDTHRWNLARKSLWTCPTGHTSSNSGVAFSPGSTHLAAMQDLDVIVRSLADGSTTKLEGLHEGDLRAAVFGESHRELFTAGVGGLVLRHFLDDPSKRPEIITRHGLHPPRDDTGNQNDTVRALDYSLESRRLATCGNDGRVQVWDLRGPELLFESSDLGDRVRDVRLSRDGRLVAAAVANGLARVWSTVDGSLVHEWKHREELWSVAFSPDGRQLAVGGDLGTIWLRDLRRPDDEPVELLHGGAVASLDYSTDGHTLASAGGERPVSLWDPVSGSRLLELPSFGGRTLQVRFADGGNTLAADVGPHIVMWTAEAAAEEDDSPVAASSTNGPSPPSSAPVTPAAYAARFRLAGNLCESDNLDTAAVALQEIADRFSPGVEPPFEIRYLQRQATREKQIARGSGGEATCLTLSPDEGLAVVGTNNGEISSLELPSEQRRVYSVDAPVQALALSPDRLQVFIATRGSPSLVTTLALPGGGTKRLGDRWGQVNAVAVSPDGRWLVAGGVDDPDGKVSVRRFDLREGLREMPPLIMPSLGEHDQPAMPIQSFAFSPDGRTLAVGHGSPAARGGRVTFWDLETGREARTRFQGLNDGAQALAYSPDGTILAAGSHEGSLRLWNVPEQRPLCTLYGDGGPIQCVAFSRDGNFVATGSAFASGPERPSQVLLWDVRQRSLAACVARFPRGVFGLEFLKDGLTLLVVTEDRMFRAIAYRDCELFQQIPAHEGSVFAMEFDGGGRLVTAGSDHVLRVWNLEQREPARLLDPGDASIRGFALAGGSKALAMIAESRELLWCDSASGKTLRRSGPLAQELVCVAQAADGAVAAADSVGGLFRWDANGQRTRDWVAPWGQVGHLLFSDHVGQMAVSSCADKVVFWDTRTGKYEAILEAGSEVRSLAVSPDHRFVAAGTKKGLIRLWSVESGKQVAATGVGRPVAALSFSADGQTLAAAADPGETCLWSVPSLEKLLSLRGPSEEVKVLRFAPDNRRLVAGLADGTLVVWRARP